MLFTMIMNLPMVAIARLSTVAENIKTNDFDFPKVDAAWKFLVCKDGLSSVLFTAASLVFFLHMCRKNFNDVPMLWAGHQSIKKDYSPHVSRLS